MKAEPPVGNPWRRVRLGVGLLGAVIVVGTTGYLLLGLSFLDALYQTVTIVTTIGFREVGEPTARFKAFTIFVALVGVGTALYTLGVLLESLVEGRLGDAWGRRKMQRHIDGLTDHVVVCGWGRVGRAIAAHLAGEGTPVVVVDRDPDRIATVSGPSVLGDATDESVLKSAGLGQARALVAALNTDSDNLYVTLTARSLWPNLFIVARARVESAELRLTQAGANRVVNPQEIGGARMAALVAHPNVAEFLDVVMHEGNIEFRLAEVELREGSPLAGQSIRDAHVRDRTGALVLAMRNADGTFLANPPPEAVLTSGHVLIAIGTSDGLAALKALADR